jgi:hypothetical protein
MQISGHLATGSFQGRPAFALAIDTNSIVKDVADPKEVHTLPCGCVVGDLQGGLTFPDAVAAALEERSTSGWKEMPTSTGDVWTIIVLDR